MNVEELKMYVDDGKITIIEALKKIDRNTRGILFVTDEAGCLQGSLTDGDVRRWLIKTGDLTACVECVMNRNPKYLFECDAKGASEYIQENHIRVIPILNAEKRIVDIAFDSGVIKKRREDKRGTLRKIPVIIMAGGKGTRLYPYTKILPKPLIPIGDIPIVERIMRRFCEYGVDEFYMTVNYKKEMIKSYFAELDSLYQVHYVEESKPLGTAGSIKLIQKQFDTPVIITNCDILIDANYYEIFQYHKESGNALTIVSALKNIVVPYGVLHFKEQGIITSMEEKQQLSYFINSGMYVLNSELVNKIPDDTFFHMTDMADMLMKEGYQVGMYPVSEESFLDMGEFEELHRMEEKLNIRTEQ